VAKVEKVVKYKRDKVLCMRCRRRRRRRRKIGKWKNGRWMEWRVKIESEWKGRSTDRR
jgi:hypothetical protein